MHTHRHHHSPGAEHDPFDADPGQGSGNGPSGPGFWPGFGRGRAFGPDGPRGFGPDGPRGFGPGGPRAFGPDGPRGFGPGGPHGFGRGGHRRRAGRGDIRTAVLLLLAEQPRHGYELIQEITERTDGAWRPSPGAIYPALALLEDEGLVTITADGGRRLASLSESGRAYVAEHADELGDPFGDATERTPRSDRALRHAARALVGAVTQVAQSGDETLVAGAQAVVERATKDLYRLLAGETPPDPAP